MLGGAALCDNSAPAVYTVKFRVLREQDFHTPLALEVSKMAAPPSTGGVSKSVSQSVTLTFGPLLPLKKRPPKLTLWLSSRDGVAGAIGRVCDVTALAVASGSNLNKLKTTVCELGAL